MARISTYTSDTDVQGNDKVIGTDASGNVTRNFELSKIADYIAYSGRSGVSAQTSTFWQADLVGGRRVGSLSTLTGGVQALDQVTTLLLSKYNTESIAHNELLSYSNQKYVFLASANRPNVFARYQVNNVIDWADNPDFALVSLVYLEGQGTPDPLETIVFAVVAGGDDKHYTHTQTVSSATWVINHNMNKKPAVTVVDNYENECVGEVEYIDENSLQITFKGAFKGKAYLN